MAKLNDVAVLDIGSKKISVMIGNKTPKGVFNVKGFGSCYYSGFSGGKWFNVQDLKSAVGKALHVAEAESGVKAKKLYIGVPSEFIAIVVKEVVLARGRAQRITDADVTELFEQGDTYKNHSRYTTIGNFAIYYTLDDKTGKLISGSRSVVILPSDTTPSTITSNTPTSTVKGFFTLYLDII